MIEPKPLTKERRAEIERAFSGRPDSEDPRLNYAVETIGDLLADSAYWLSAVLGNGLSSVTSKGGGTCYFCSEWIMDTEARHEPDCPWLKAQA